MLASMAKDYIRRSLTQEERDDKRRLRALWDKEKSERGITQAEFAHMIGLANQSGVGNYLNTQNNIALNPDIIFKFAEFLRVSIGDISPTLSAQFMALQAAETGLPLSERSEFNHLLSALSTEERDHIRQTMRLLVAKQTAPNHS